MTTVATLRLPIPIRGLVEMVEALTLTYGEGLTMQQADGFLVISQVLPEEGESGS